MGMPLLSNPVASRPSAKAAAVLLSLLLGAAEVVVVVVNTTQSDAINDGHQLVFILSD